MGRQCSDTGAAGIMVDDGQAPLSGRRAPGCFAEFCVLLLWFALNNNMYIAWVSKCLGGGGRPEDPSSFLVPLDDLLEHLVQKIHVPHVLVAGLLQAALDIATRVEAVASFQCIHTKCGEDVELLRVQQQ